jgi:hypothetical protein
MFKSTLFQPTLSRPPEAARARCLVLAAALAIVAALVCLTPRTLHAQAGAPAATHAR